MPTSRDQLKKLKVKMGISMAQILERGIEKMYVEQGLA